MVRRGSLTLKLLHLVAELRYLDRGAWGTTRVDDGTNRVRIPNLNVTVAGNVIANRRQQGDELLDIPAQFNGQPQNGSGLGPVRADEGLRIYHNLFALGRALPDGTENCSAPDCATLRSRNTVTAPSNPFRAPAHGDLTLTRHWATATLPTFDWSGFPPRDRLTRRVPHPSVALLGLIAGHLRGAARPWGPTGSVSENGGASDPRQDARV